jgi:hypothetical protein
VSSGPRIANATARTLIADLLHGVLGPVGHHPRPEWAQLATVGSVRRERPDVGDVELAAPLPPAKLGVGGDSPLTQVTDRGIAPLDDPLFLALNRVVENPVKIDIGLFQANPLDQLRGWDAGYLHEEGITIRAMEGFSPGFRAMKLAVWWSELPPGVAFVQAQIFRYTPANRGWVLLMRTGPSSFGEYFLQQWKRTHRIPRDRQASIQGHLVDTMGRVVPVADEGQAFRLCGMEPIPAERRQEYIDRLRVSQEHLHS